MCDMVVCVVVSHVIGPPPDVNRHTWQCLSQPAIDLQSAISLFTCRTPHGAVVADKMADLPTHLLHLPLEVTPHGAHTKRVDPVVVDGDGVFLRDSHRGTKAALRTRERESTDLQD